MSESTAPPPLKLKIVAWMFMAGGMLCLADLLFALMDNQFKFNPGFLLIFVGMGLLRLQGSWRIWAMFVLWLHFIAVPFLLVLLIIFPEARLSEDPTEGGSRVVLIAVLAIDLALAIWQYRVLINKEISALFTFQSLEKLDQK